MTTPARTIAWLRDGITVTRNDWAREADRLNLWAAGTDAQHGGRETTVTALARFRAAVLRLGAALLGAKP